jgi:hypothetical protein
MTDDLEAATDRVFAAMDDYRTGEAVHATRQVAKALARAALEGVREKVEARTECPIGLDDRRNLCSAGTCRPCLYDRVKSTKARAEKAEADAEKLEAVVSDCVVSLESAKSFIVLKTGCNNRMRDETIDRARAALAAYKAGAD